LRRRHGRSKTIDKQELNRLLYVTHGGGWYAKKDITMPFLKDWCGL
jgi:hypothetical protein